MGRRITENWREAIARPSPLNAPASFDCLGRRADSVAIHGFVWEGLRALPTNDPDWEVWGLNSGWWYVRDKEDRFRADRWFELHPLSVQTPTELEAIQGCPVPIYLTEPRVPPDIPNGRIFPLPAILHLGGGTAPFACTFAYQIALAIHLGFRRIGLYGCELQMGTLRERTVERASVAYWIGVARGRDIEVVTPAWSGVVSHPRLYGFDYHSEKDLVDVYQMECVSVGALHFARHQTLAYLEKERAAAADALEQQL